MATARKSRQLQKAAAKILLKIRTVQMTNARNLKIATPAPAKKSNLIKSSKDWPLLVENPACPCTKSPRKSNTLDGQRRKKDPGYPTLRGACCRRTVWAFRAFSVPGCSEGMSLVMSSFYDRDSDMVDGLSWGTRSDVMCTFCDAHLEPQMWQMYRCTRMCTCLREGCFTFLEFGGPMRGAFWVMDFEDPSLHGNFGA